MRLINVKTYEIEEFPDDEKRPRYNILSHVWGQDEVTLHDMQSKKYSRKAGFTKIRKVCEMTAKDKGSDVRYCWVDTCCIDKTSSAELSEAINSMYRWYAESAVCYAFLEDVDTIDAASLKRSKWFTRGWTLQELIAPKMLYHYDRKWQIIEPGVSTLREATNLPITLLAKELTPQDYSVAQRLSWAAKRETTRKEDMAYCLMGLLDVNMPLLYGEGGERAFRRLQEEFIKHSDDLSIFAWTSTPDFSYSREDSVWGSIGRGLLAPNVSCFADCGSVRQGEAGLTNDTPIEEYHLSNRGLSISLVMNARSPSTYIAELDCSAVHHHGSRVARCNVGILLHQLHGARKRYARVSKNREDIIYACSSEWSLASRDGPQLHQRVFVPLASSFLFRDWSISVKQLRGDETTWKPVPGTPTAEDYYTFAGKNSDYYDPSPGRDFYSYRETGRTIYVLDSVISAVRFGIDANYNPVVFFLSAARPDAFRWFGAFVWNDEEINNFVICPEAKWHHYGYFAVRGHWETGLRCELHFLNLYIKITGQKLWNIQFKTLSEHVQPPAYDGRTLGVETSRTSVNPLDELSSDAKKSEH